MRKRLKMAVIGIALVLICGFTIHTLGLSIWGYDIRVIYESTGGFFMDACDEFSPMWYDSITYNKSVLTTDESATISISSNNEIDAACDPVFVLSGGSAALKIEPSAEQTITLDPGENKIPSWTLSVSYPSSETVYITKNTTPGIKAILQFRFVPALLGLTGDQMVWAIHAGLLLGMALIVRCLLDPVEDNADV